MAKTKGVRQRKLSPMQERFCDEYLIDLNASKAAERAGFSKKSAMFQGYQLLQKPLVTERINQLKSAQSERTLITADKVLTELYRIATVDISQAYDEAGWLKRLSEIPEDVRRAISGLEVDEIFQGQGEDKSIIGVSRKVKFNDKIRALELLGKHLKLFTEKHEHSGPDGKPIQTRNVSALTDEELDAELALHMAKGKT